MKKIIFLSFVCLHYGVYAQQVGINTSAPDPSAVLDIFSHDKGVLLPRLSQSSRDAIVSPENGLIIYNTDEGCFNFIKNGLWTSLCSKSEPSSVIVIPMVYGDTINVGQSVIVGDGTSSYVSIEHGGAQTFTSYGSKWLAQTFRTSSQAKAIHAVEFLVSFSGWSNFFASLRFTSQGVPVGGNIETVPAMVFFNQTGGSGWRIHMKFDPPVPVQPDSVYALLAYASDGVFWGGSDGYADGTYCVSMDSGMTWVSVSSKDMNFRIFEIQTEQSLIYPHNLNYQANQVINAGNQFMGHVSNSNHPYGQGDRMTNFIGFALESGLPGEVHMVQVGGIVDVFSGLTPGNYYYLDDQTPGAISSKPNGVHVGVALDSTRLLLK